MEWIELGTSGGVAAAPKSKAEVDRIPTDGLGIFTAVTLKVRERVTRIVDVRVCVVSTTALDN